MATDIAGRKSAVVKQLGHDVTSWEFYAAVREMERHFSELPRVGCAGTKSEDPISFGQQPELRFAPSELSTLTAQNRSGNLLLLTPLFGLCGPSGPLPLHMTELAQNRIRHYDDVTLACFMDMFNHRMISFYYRSWALNEQAVSSDRADDDWFQKAVASFAGLNDSSFEQRDELSTTEKLSWTGRLMPPSRNAEGLVEILKGVFKQPVKLVPFVGRWIELPEDCQCRLSNRNSAVLGQNAVLGTNFFEAAQKFRLEIGPLDLEAYEKFLPDGDLFRKLNDWIMTYGADPLYCEVVLILKGESIPECRLGSYGKLGYTTWLGSPDKDMDYSDFSKEIV